MSLFSQRNAPPPSQLRYDVPEPVRSRIVAILDHHIGGGRTHGIFFNKLTDLLMREYGGLAQSSYEAARRSKISVIEHFYTCSDEHALDFIEACFQLNISCCGQNAADEINRVFRQNGVGYELTRCSAGPQVRGEVRFGLPIPEEQLPRIIRIDNQQMHVETVAPALQLLSNPIFSVASAEMLKAHTDHRSGRHEDAITACGSAFESVLKTICDQKGWAYDADKDTCAALVDRCYKQDLFPSFYVEIFKRVGTVRNKLGDAHGRGPNPVHDVEAAHAEHLLHMASAHILLLAKLAALE